MGGGQYFETELVYLSLASNSLVAKDDLNSDLLCFHLLRAPGV